MFNKDHGKRVGDDGDIEYVLHITDVDSNDDNDDDNDGDDDDLVSQLVS